MRWQRTVRPPLYDCGTQLLQRHLGVLGCSPVCKGGQGKGECRANSSGSQTEDLVCLGPASPAQRLEKMHLAQVGSFQIDLIFSQGLLLTEPFSRATVLHHLPLKTTVQRHSSKRWALKLSARCRLQPPAQTQGQCSTQHLALLQPSRNKGAGMQSRNSIPKRSPWPVCRHVQAVLVFLLYKGIPLVRHSLENGVYWYL